MHRLIFEEFRNIVAHAQVSGRVLEIGATADESTLLNMDLLVGHEKIGVNIVESGSFNGFDILQASGTDLSIFDDNSFDCVLSNATIEHEPRFWKIAKEIHRVLRVGGVAIVGAPGYSRNSDTTTLHLSKPSGDDPLSEWDAVTLVYRYHEAPKDYYRFSVDAFREVIFDGYDNIEVKTVMVPPRLIGYGIKAVRSPQS